ncbi:MAG: transposase, partial [Clostridiales bacterium]|nr:transposase [Clostridiales bacterium]
MKIVSTYSVKIKDYNHIFDETVSIYRKVVDYFINVCICEWENVSKIDSNHYKQQYIESLCHMTKDNYNVKYHSFDKKFYKFPSYLRRGAIVEAIGKVSSYKSNLSRWESAEPKTRGKKPSYPKAGYVYPCMYRTVMYEKTGPYEAKIKVFVRNTWDWITVQLRKSDVDYITRRGARGEICAPTLQKRGHEWFLDYPLEEYAKLSDTNIFKQTIVAVDLGINSAAAISVMHSDGTVIGR